MCLESDQARWARECCQGGDCPICNPQPCGTCGYADCICTDTMIEDKVNDIMDNITIDQNLCTIRYALTRYFEEGFDEEVRDA